MDDKLNLKQYIRTVDDFPIPGIKFRDITSLIENPDGLIKSCNAFTELTKEFGAPNSFVSSVNALQLFIRPSGFSMRLVMSLNLMPGMGKSSTVLMYCFRFNLSSMTSLLKWCVQLDSN